MKNVLLCCGLAFLFACGDDNITTPQPADTFNRRELLTNWADHLIIPGYTDLATQLTLLSTAAQAFADAPAAGTLNDLRQQWETAYFSWQKVALIDIGQAEELTLRNFLNIYPTDPAGIAANAESGAYNLTLPSEFSRQGFPALDYLLFGLRETDADLLSLYLDPSLGAPYSAYLLAVVTRMEELVTTVRDDWSTGYRETFVSNDGSSATAAVDKVVNDYLFYYERFLRAGKVGIPAGVFSGSPLPGNVEAYYRRNLSKELLLAALTTTQDFFNGQHLGGNTRGTSLADYLNERQVQKNGLPLSTVINNQFNAASDQIITLQDDFVAQIAADNNALLVAFDLLQVNVVHLKVDMLQALNINVDFVDADGD